MVKVKILTEDNIIAGGGVADDLSRGTFQVTLDGAATKVIKDNDYYIIEANDTKYGIQRQYNIADAGYHCHCTEKQDGIANFEKIVDEESPITPDLIRAHLCKDALKAAKKSVIVEINPEDLVNLKKSGYNLCFAKKVGEADYNVVWESLNGTQYLPKNIFSWEPQYQVFGTNTFQADVKVEESTGPKDIGIGQVITLDQNGLFGEPSDSTTDKHKLTVANNFGSIHIGISQKCIAGGKSSTSAIYVGKTPTLKGNESFQPKEKLIIWFQTKIETGTMFVDRRTKSIQVDLTNKDSASVRYSNQEWKNI